MSAEHVAVPIPSEIEPIAFLLGQWTGQGKGHYPTIQEFEYREDVRFWHVGKPFLAYTQRTWSLNDKPLHSEMGFWRPQSDGRIEVVLAHPSGIAEIEEGTVERGRIELTSTKVTSTSTAKRVDELRRVFEVDGDLLTYTVEMAAVSQPLQGHLTATLKRAPHD